jgi:putative ABC transport system ATP-binding protein
VESRHRLGLLDDTLKERLVKARSLVRKTIEKADMRGVEFYDPEAICPAAPLRDNLLFGRVSYRVANARVRVAEAISAVVRELGLLQDIKCVGLDHQVGTAGRLLTPQERTSINLVRCLVKRPDIMVIDGALAPFDEARNLQMTELLLELFDRQSLFMVLPNDRQAGSFDIQLRFRDGQISTEKSGKPAPKGKRSEPEASQTIEGEVA